MADDTNDAGGPSERDAEATPAKKHTKKSTKKASTKKASAKKGSAKKTSQKKTSQQKSATKKAAKKAAAKKAAAKKAGTKKAGTKKATKAAGGNAGATKAALPDPDQAPRPWVEAYPRNIPSTYSYPNVALTRLLDDAATDFPEHEAIQFLGASTTYRQLLDHVDRFASALAELGVDRGDCVGVVLPNCPQHVVTVCATLRLGAIVVESDPDTDERERARQLSEARCKVIVCLDPIYLDWTRPREAVPSVEHIIVTGLQDALPFPKNVWLPLAGGRDGTYAKVPAGEGVLRMTELVAQSVPAPPPVEVAPATDIATVVFTRGTTATPKGVRLTHANVVANVFQARLWVPDMQAGGENVLAVVPFAHAYGFTACLGLALLSAATLTVLPRFEPGSTLKTIERRKPTVFPGVTAMFEALRDAPGVDKHDLSSLRVCVAGGQSLGTELARELERLSGAKVREGYGLSEASPITHANPIYGKSKRGTIGLPLPDTACILRDLDDPAQPAPEGGPGELAVAGPQVTVGYWNRSAGPADAFRDGWLLTGDVATVDEEGYFSVLERKADLIDVGGRRVFPGEVERVLTTHAAVGRAVVAGMGDSLRGQRVKAYVTLAGDQQVSDDDLLTYLGERLASYKLPHHIEFRDDLPIAAERTELRRRLVEHDSASDKV